MPISSLHIFNERGKTLISRNYRGDIDQSLVEKFPAILAECAENEDNKPLINYENFSFGYVRHNDLALVATAKGNANISMIFSFLYKFLKVVKEYLDEVNEETIRDNFVFLYELLDEMLDFGYPQTTEARVLQDYITQERYELPSTAARVPLAVTNAVSWRPDGLKYEKNEVFLDVIESVNLLMSSKGHVIRSEVIGSVNMRVFLTGMPELRLGLNDNFGAVGQEDDKGVRVEDVKFHQCVRLARFEADRTIAFIPPDGTFELMSYRLETTPRPLVHVECDVQNFERSRVIYRVRARSQFKSRSTAKDVEILIPAPSDADSPIISASHGSARYQAEKGGVVWKMKSFPGGKEVTLTAELRLPSVAPAENQSTPPITVKFEIPYFTTSGVQIRHLKIAEKSGYTALPWVRYITRSGDYMIRM